MANKKYKIGLVLPDVLGLYGDSGNAVVLAARMNLRGITAEIISLSLDDKIPANLDAYTLGGAEDFAQQTAVKFLTKDEGLRKGIENGATTLAICAATQILGHSYKSSDNQEFPGLNILDCISNPMQKRAIGELVVDSTFENESFLINGFENHRGNTEIGSEASPLGKVKAGIGNGNNFDGVQQYNVFGTYMHGPVLARNPEFADFLIRKITGLKELDPINIPEMNLFKSQRLKAAKI